jgi:hypothetical protein
MAAAAVGRNRFSAATITMTIICSKASVFQIFVGRFNYPSSASAFLFPLCGLGLEFGALVTSDPCVICSMSRTVSKVDKAREKKQREEARAKRIQVGAEWLKKVTLYY